MSCLRRQPVTIPMDTVKMIQSEKFSRECPIPVTQPRYAPPPRVAWDGGGEGEVIVNQACGDLSMEVNGNTVVPPRPLVSPPAPVLRREASYLAQRKTSTSDICYHQFHYKMDNVIVKPVRAPLFLHLFLLVLHLLRPGDAMWTAGLPHVWTHLQLCRQAPTHPFLFALGVWGVPADLIRVLS